MSKSERRQDEIDETKRIVYARAAGPCEYVDTNGDRCPEPGVEIAHIIPQDKTHKKIYGERLLHHPENLVLTCGKYHNSKVELDVKTQPLAVAAHAHRLMTLLAEEDEFEND